MAEQLTVPKGEQPLIMQQFIDLPAELWLGYILPHCSWEFVRVSTYWNHYAFPLLFYDERFKPERFATILPQSVYEGYEKTVAAVLKHPAHTGLIGETLYYAISQGHLNITKLLLQEKQIVISYNHWFEEGSVLKWAIDNHQTAILAFLMNDTRIPLRTLQRIARDYLGTAKAVEMVEYMLDHPRLVLDVPEAGNFLVVAAVNNHPTIVSKLIHMHPDINIKRREEALQEAVAEDSVKIVETLLACGADINLNAKNGKYLLTAIRYNCTKVVEYFIGNPSVDISINNNAPLVRAVRYHRLEILKLLLRSPRVDPHVLSIYDICSDESRYGSRIVDISEIVDVILSHPAMQSAESRLKFLEKPVVKTQ